MNFSEFLSEVKKLNFQQVRADQPDYLECVLGKDLLAGLSPLLENYFGPAVKPPGKSPKGKDQEISSPLGGIQKNQTLYWAQRDGNTELAMLWPWGDGVSVTLKMARRP